MSVFEPETVKAVLAAALHPNDLNKQKTFKAEWTKSVSVGLLQT